MAKAMQDRLNNTKTPSLNWGRCLSRFPLFALLLLLLCQCTSKAPSTCKLSGELTGLDDQPLLLWGVNQLYDRLDTIPVENGRFSVTLPIDTVAETLLCMPDGQLFPLFLEKGKKIVVTGSLPDSVTVTGSELNDSIYALLAVTAPYRTDSLDHIMYSLRLKLDTLKETIDSLNALKGKAKRQRLDSLKNKIDSLNLHRDTLTALRDSIKLQRDTLVLHTDSLILPFIERNPGSAASVFVLRHFYTNEYSPDKKRVKKALSKLAPYMLDYQLVSKLDKYVDNNDVLKLQRTLPNFSLPDSLDVSFNRFTFSGQWLLLQFWASWDPQSRNEHKALLELNREQQKIKNKEQRLAILGISLDADRKQWMTAIQEDSLTWNQLCDFRSWNTPLIKRIGLENIPANVLVNERGTIVGFNLTLDEIKEKIKEIRKPEEKKRR